MNNSNMERQDAVDNHPQQATSAMIDVHDNVC